jgi:hypothetical protein
MLMNADQVAKELGITATTVRAMCRSGKIKAVNTGAASRAYWRISLSEVKRVRAGLSNRSDANGNGSPQTFSPPEGWVTVAEAAVQLGLSQQRVHQLRADGRLRSVEDPTILIGSNKPRFYVDPTSLAKKAKMGRPTRASRTMSDPVKVETPNRVQLPMWLDLAKQVVAVQETLQEMSHDLSLVVNTQSTFLRGQEETDRRIKRLCEAWGVDVD